MPELVLRRLEEGVGIVSLNRPDRHNAVNDEMGPMLREALQWAIESPDVRCILLRGEGKSFCSGRDTTVLGHRERDESDFAFVRRAQDGRISMLEEARWLEYVQRVSREERGVCLDDSGELGPALMRIATKNGARALGLAAGAIETIFTLAMMSD